MIPPAIHFHDRYGKQVDLSTIESRDAVSSAELGYIVDIGAHTWCHPCQRADCEHAEMVEHALEAAGLGASQHIAFPHIARITRYRAMGETIAGCWFDNGVRLRYHEQDDGSVSQVVFTPENPQEPAETTVLPDAEGAEISLVEVLAAYSEYRRERDVEGLCRKWPGLGLVVGWTDGGEGEGD